MNERRIIDEKTILSLLSSQQDDLKKIGDILNEKIAQDLYAIRVSLQSYVLQYGKNEVIDGVKKAITSCIANVRHVADYLYPSLLKDYGLKRALEELIKEFRKKNNIVILSVDAKINDIGSTNLLFLYRLFQLYFEEALINYSSRRLEVVIKLRNNMINIIIADDFVTSTETHWLNMENNTNVQKIKNLVLLKDGIFETKSKRDGIELILTFLNNCDD